MTEPRSSSAGTIWPYQDRINIVASDQPFQWLAAGWRDLRRGGWISAAFGLFFCVVGLALTVGLALADLEYLIGPLVAGFMLVGPALTVGHYAISRDLEAGRAPSLVGAFTAWRANAVSLLSIGLVLVVFLVVWMRFAVVIFAISFPHQNITLGNFVDTALFTWDGNLFLAIGTVVGAIMATIVFTFCVVALPLMLDRRAGIIEAMVTSAVAVILNPRVMALWAVLVVLFTGVGLLFAYVGLALTLPLIGHASWHAYRALVKPE